jgi:hypothetical protein
MTCSTVIGARRASERQKADLSMMAKESLSPPLLWGPNTAGQEMSVLAVQRRHRPHCWRGG